MTPEIKISISFSGQGPNPSVDLKTEEGIQPASQSQASDTAPAPPEAEAGDPADTAAQPPEAPAAEDGLGNPAEMETFIPALPEAPEEEIGSGPSQPEVPVADTNGSHMPAPPN